MRELSSLERAILEKLLRSRRAGGPRDELVLKAAGHLRIEKYDVTGRVLEVREQPNTIVSGARNILLRALAGEPVNQLYLSPFVSNQNDYNTLYWAPTYTPLNLYRHQNSSSTQVWWNNNATGGYYNSLAKSPVLYSTNSVLFMGMGDGVSLLYPNNDPALVYSGQWARVTASQDPDLSSAVSQSLMRTYTAGDTVTMNFKGPFLKIYATRNMDGGIMNISVDGQPVNVVYPDSTVHQDIDLFASEEVHAVCFTVEQSFDPSIEHVVVLTHSGLKNENAASPFMVNVEALETDGVRTNQGSLFREIPTVQNRFEAGEYYNTSSTAPYSFDVLHPFIQPGSETVKVENTVYTKAPTGVAPGPGQYQYVYDSNNNVKGLKFSEQLTGVMVAYTSTVSYPTDYKRAYIERPTSGPDAPFYNLNTGKVVFAAEFPPGVPNYNIVVRELGLFAGPRLDDNVLGFTSSMPAEMFSMVRTQPMTKNTDTGLRIRWTIALNIQ